MRKATTRRGTEAAFGELQSIALTQPPCVEGRFRQQHAEGISNTSNSDFHTQIITRYYIDGNATGREDNRSFGYGRRLVFASPVGHWN